MSKEKLYGLRDQLSKFLYDPTAKQMVERKKLFDEQRFGEILEQNKRVEKYLEEVEKQIEAVEAAEPSIGKKMVTNFLLNLPLGKQLKGIPGLGSLLGLAEEEMGAAETQRLKDIEQKLDKLQNWEGTAEEQVKTGLLTLEEGREATKKLYSDIETLEDEAYELKKLLSTRLSDEPEWMPEENQFEPSPREQAKWEAENFRQKQLDQRSERYWNAEEVAQEEAYYKRIEGEPEGPGDRQTRLFKEFIKDKTDLTFAEEEFLKAYPEFGSPSTRQLTPKQILEELGAQEGTVFDEELLKNAEGLAKSMGISTEDLQNALQQGEKEGLMSLIGKTPTTGERIAHFTLPGNAAKILEEGYDATLPPVHGTGGLQGGPREGKAGGDILYFTTDEGRWSKAEVYVGEGEGNISREVYDYDKQKWVEDKNAYKKVNLEKVEAVIKENVRTLTIDSWEAAKDFGVAPQRHGFIEEIVNKAKAEGYDIVNLKNPEGTAWHSPTGEMDKYGEKDWYDTLTGGSGKDDYFILNKEVVEMVAPEIKDTPTEGYQSGGLIMNYGDYGRSYT